MGAKRLRARSALLFFDNREKSSRKESAVVLESALAFCEGCALRDQGGQDGCGSGI